MCTERKMSPSEIVDYIENKIQIDVGVLSAEEIVKTTEVFDAAIELIESAGQLEKDNALLRQGIAELKKANKDLETDVAINKGAMRAYREACENAQDDAVKDFCHFIIDKSAGGSIEIDELPDLVVEWGSPSRKSAEVMKEVNEAFQKGIQKELKPFSAELRSSASPDTGVKKFYLTCRNPKAEHWIAKRFRKVQPCYIRHQRYCRRC